MLPGHRTPARFLVAALLAGASACSDSTAPVAKLPSGAALAAGVNNDKVKIKNVRFSSNTLKINGANVDVDVSIANSGPAIQTGLSLRAEIVQGAASHQ